MYQRILVPLEGEGGPEAHLWHAAQLAKEAGGDLTLLRIITVVPSDEYFFKRLQVEEGSKAAKSKEDAEVYVDRLARELGSDGVSARPEVLISDRAEDEAIVAHAAETESDLIVLPRQRRSLFSRWLQGNVTAKVQRRASVPILTVREEQGEG
jgi:nucleotide-binding universal stress UspA family protein